MVQVARYLVSGASPPLHIGQVDPPTIGLRRSVLGSVKENHQFRAYGSQVSLL